MRTRSTTIGELVVAGALLMGDGYRTNRSELGEPGYRIIRVSDVGDGTVSLDSPDFVHEDRAQQIGVKAGEPGDVLLTTKGTVGRVAVLPRVDGPVVYSPQLCFFRVLNEAIVDPRFLRHWFASPAFLHQASDRMNNTDMAAYINLADIRSLQLALPSPDDQRAIADVLGALDDKIAANTQLTKTATALSAALFSSMNETEPMPLTKVADFVNGRAFTKDASGTGRVVVRIAELNSGIGGSTVFSDAEVPDQHVARPGDILFAWSGSLTLHRWFRSEAIVNQHIFKVIPRAGYPHWLVWGLLTNRLDEFKSIAADKATTMGHIQRRHLEEPVAVPVPALVARHNDAMTALWDRALAAEVESLTLAATRDALLPALLSGRLRVRDAASGIPQSPR